ncbi:hypothetical protein [Candidatus Neptunochlamydia vexilliferae]|uniref:Uncharacterized protein n=1 Tax=Candidatus Neptunichlamydia vexilliferae TaxID=1651774 RepID=A0ABS0B030_9BACT|nr:hypothetical protein [Candidatus Neptunochlamydia vexilliferae]MBF5059076.1 hypothetical protein [Candidatus Neptunochlamydia vexilliferae]
MANLIVNNNKNNIDLSLNQNSGLTSSSSDEDTALNSSNNASTSSSSSSSSSSSTLNTSELNNIESSASNSTRNEPQAHSYSLGDLKKSAHKLYKEIEKIKTLEELSSQPSAEQAKLLCKIAKGFQRDLFFQPEKEKTLKDLIKKQEVPFSLAYRMVDILSAHEIQSYDALKRALAKAACFFIELNVFHFHAQKRNVYQDTVDQMIRLVSMVEKTLPKLEVEAKFHLKCSKAALKKLSFGVGRVKTIAKDRGVQILKGALEAGLSRSGAPIVAPLVDTSLEIYKRLEEKWYKKVWRLKWTLVANPLENLNALASIKDCLKKWESRPDLAFAITQVFGNALEGKSTEALKKSLLFEGNVSLEKLAKLKKSRTSLWNVRFHAITVLKASALRSDFDNVLREKSIEIIWNRKRSETNENVKNLINNAIADLGNTYSQLMEEISSKEKDPDKEISRITNLIETDKHIKELPKIIQIKEQLAENLIQAKSDQQSMAGGNISDLESKIDHLEQLEEERQNKLDELKAETQFFKDLKQFRETKNWDDFR